MTVDPAAPAKIGLRSERGPVLISVMLSTGLVALDSTIIATAVPSVVTDLGGFAQYPWLFSVYLLTQAVTVPLYGKFADVLGRKPVMVFGIGLFLTGSVLCGFAWNMLSLIIFRAVQGLGAGAVLPISMTIIGDIYSVQERAKVQGYTASVWGAASVLGPTLGGVFSQYLTWRWIFFVNVPVGALAVWMLVHHLHENVIHRPHKIDYTGAVLLTTGCTLLILGLLEGGVAWSWDSTWSMVVFVGGAVALVAFVAVEMRATEPILPMWVFRHRSLVGGNLGSLVVGVVLIGLSSYVPSFAQGVLGTGALVAGFILAAMSVGWPIASALSGRAYMRIGFRDTALIGAAVIILGTVLSTLLPRYTHVLELAGVCFVMGCGLGLASTPILVAVQSVVGWDRRGVVTGTNMFFRSMGSAVGAAVFGAIANGVLTDRFRNPPSALVGRLPANADATGLVLGGKLNTEPGAVTAYIRDSLYQAVHHVVLAMIVVAVLGVVAVALMPRRTTEIDATPVTESASL
ncbi:MAG: MDR family MFS transporter [Jatrophihabitantaceae bacterium]